MVRTVLDSLDKSYSSVNKKWRTLYCTGCILIVFHPHSRALRPQNKEPRFMSCNVTRKYKGLEEYIEIKVAKEIRAGAAKTLWNILSKLQVISLKLLVKEIHFILWVSFKKVQNLRHRSLRALKATACFANLKTINWKHRRIENNFKETCPCKWT